jgi:hypothetical protein
MVSLALQSAVNCEFRSLGRFCSRCHQSLNRERNSAGSLRPIWSFSAPKRLIQPPGLKEALKIVNHEHFGLRRIAPMFLSVQFFKNGGVTPASL